ncbi:hypothetical protein F4805DRAFT_478418 [Annulohypoxylon moriforme]|nr:hypothetical protein F4805DRAFT_478418 [Annulohypoxylon moriforme]
MNSISLPQEIILLLCQELAARRDFGTLFNCSLVSKRVASIALEQIIQDLSSIDTGDDYNRLEWARLWRSLILSSIGETAYPYCIYVRALSIGNLEDCLSDIIRDQHVRNFFFQGPMAPFHLLRNGRLATITVMIKCADSIIRYLKSSADSTGAAVALEHLEGTYIPHDVLPGWIAQLRGLKSLRIRDGSVLGLDAATAISQHCPNFMDLICYYCTPDADTDLATFFLTLRPNSLQSFEIISKNEIGPNALTALSTHSKSLRSLSLRSISLQAKKALPHLSSCTALETLYLESGIFYGPPNGDDFGDMVIIKKIIAWIGNCKSLKDLRVHITDALHIVKGVLQSPDIHLTSLSMIDIGYASEEADTSDWVILGSQDRLESLTLGFDDSDGNGLILNRGFGLLDSICNLKSLTSLNLMLSYVTPDVVRLLALSLPKLSEFSFSGDVMDDSILEPLGKLSQLKLLSINCISIFSLDGLHKLAVDLDTQNCRDIRMDILNQSGELKFREPEYLKLQQDFAKTLQGRIEINYYMDPDELHEIDFSDSD